MPPSGRWAPPVLRGEGCGAERPGAAQPSPDLTDCGQELRIVVGEAAASSWAPPPRPRAARLPPIMQAPAPARQPALDGVRGLAILLVLVHHWTTPPAALAFGWTGADLFFVLSAFLLGGRLQNPPPSPPGYSRGFYGRRAFRILPLYALTLVGFAAM